MRIARAICESGSNHGGITPRLRNTGVQVCSGAK